MTSPFHDRTGATVGQSLKRRSFAWLALATVFAATLPGCGGSDSESGPKSSWASAWAAAPQDYNEAIPLPGRAQPVAGSYVNTTLRQLVRPAVNGSQLRVKLSNVTGNAAVSVAAASVARSASASLGSVDAASINTVLFGGNAAVTIAPGAEVWSDPVTMSVTAGADLAVSLYLQQDTAFATVHRSAFRQTFVVTGNATTSAALTGATMVTRLHLLSGLDVGTEAPPTVVAAFGDSITDGTASTVDALKRYPDQLAQRVQADAAAAGKVSVLNLGIAGNRVLNDKLGPKGIGRFERDVLQQSGVTHTLILLGINDIGFAAFSGSPYNTIPASEVVTSDQIIEGYQQMLAAAKAKGVKVLLGTLLPFKGAGYYNDANEIKRQAVNTWIRAQAANVHAIVEFDMAMRSAADPLALNPAFDAGDHLHPNDAGYAALAAAVDLARLLN